MAYLNASACSPCSRNHAVPRGGRFTTPLNGLTQDPGSCCAKCAIGCALGDSGAGGSMIGVLVAGAAIIYFLLPKRKTA